MIDRRLVVRRLIQAVLLGQHTRKTIGFSSGSGKRRGIREDGLLGETLGGFCGRRSVRGVLVPGTPHYGGAMNADYAHSASKDSLLRLFADHFGGGSIGGGLSVT